MALERESRFWLGILLGSALLLWLLSSILLPFVVGMAIGYFLDPVVARLTRWGLTRGVAAAVLILGSFVVGTLALLLVLPPLVDQALDLAQRLPAFMAAAHERLAPLLTHTPGTLAEPLNGILKQAAGGATSLLGRVVSEGAALLNVVSLLAVTPLVAFYLLRDWPRIIAEIDGWLPRAHAETIRAQAGAIDAVLAGFARGAAIVCGALALSLVGLNFGLVIGLVAGALSFVPYLGFAVGLVSSVGVAFYQFWPSWVRVVVVLAIFLAGQVLTDYVLTPRLVGERTGLHPLWVIFGAFAGGALFGFAGLLLSVPACAAIGVLARFGIARYKESGVYQGPREP